MKHYTYLFVYVLVLFQLGCSIGKASKPSDFYVLSAETGSAGKALPASMSLGVGPLTLPDLYDRPQIVTRPETNRITLAEFDRWGGDVRDNLRRVLARNLSTRLGTDAVRLYPWSGSNTPDLQVTVAFERFGGDLGGMVKLSGIWRVLDGDRGCELARRSFTLSESTAGQSYADYVSALSRGLAKLSQEIAARVAVTKPGCTHN